MATSFRYLHTFYYRSKFLVAFLLIFIFALSFTFSQTSEKKAFNQAENLRKQNKCNEAISLYEAAIKEGTNNYRYFFGKALCEYKLDNIRSAKRSLERTIESNKTFTPAYTLLAKIYRLEKDYDNALFYYKAAASVETNDTRRLQYHLLVINLLMKETRIDEVKEHLDAAQELDADHPSLLYYKAELFTMEGNWEEAKEAYQSALSSERMKATPSSDKARYYYGLGLAYKRLGENEKAEKAWENANFGPYKKLIENEKAKNNHQHLYKIAVSYYLQGEYSESEKHLEQALGLNESFVNAYVLKGKIAEKQGRMDEAISNYQQAISMETDGKKAAKIRIMEAEIHLDNQHGERALSALEPAVATFPNNIEWQYLKARAAYLADEYETAIQTLEVLLAGNVNEKTSAKYNFLLGMSAKRNGDIEKAKASFKKALYGSYRDAARVELEKLGGR